MATRESERFSRVGQGNGISFPSIGTDSEAFGLNASAVGFSTAVGKDATCTDGNSVAIGNGAISGTGVAGRNVVIGQGAQAQVEDCVVIGFGASCTGPGIGRETAVGRGASCTTDNGVAIGAGAVTTSIGGIAIGDNAQAGGNMDSIAIGRDAVVAIPNNAVMGAAAHPILDFTVVGSAGIDPLKVISVGLGAGNTGLFVVIDNGALVVRQVRIGAINSGGAGQRLLTVDN